MRSCFKRVAFFLLLPVALACECHSAEGEPRSDATKVDELRVAFDRYADSRERIDCLKHVFFFGRATAQYSPRLLALFQKTDEPGTVRRQVAELLLRADVPTAMQEVLRMRDDAAETIEWRAECIGLIAFQYGRTKSRELQNFLWSSLDSKATGIASRAFEELVAIALGEAWSQADPAAEQRLKKFCRSRFDTQDPVQIASACRAVAYARWNDLQPSVESLALSPQVSKELRLEALESLRRFSRLESAAVVESLSESSSLDVARAAREALPYVALKDLASWGADGVPAAEQSLRNEPNQPQANALRAFISAQVLKPRMLSPITEALTLERLSVDAVHRRVMIPAKFAQTRGPLEYILVRNGSDELHESLMVASVTPSEIRAALNSIGMKGVISDRHKGIVTVDAPESLVLSVQYTIPSETDGNVQRAVRVPVETLIRHTSEAWSMPASPWFLAANPRTPLRKGNDLIALMDDAGATIQNATQVAEAANVIEGVGAFLAHHALCPPKDTACTLVLEPISRDAPIPPIHAQRALTTRELAEAIAYPLPMQVRMQLVQRLAMSSGNDEARKNLLAVVQAPFEPSGLRQKLAELLIHWHTPEIYQLLDTTLAAPKTEARWRCRTLEIFAFDYTRTLRAESVGQVLNHIRPEIDPVLRSTALACATRLALNQGWRTTDPDHFKELEFFLRKAFASNEEAVLRAACYAAAELRLSEFLPALESIASNETLQPQTRAEALWSLRYSTRVESLLALEANASAAVSVRSWAAQSALAFALTEMIQTKPQSADEIVQRLKAMGERAWPALYAFFDRYPRSTEVSRIKQIFAAQQATGAFTTTQTLASPAPATEAEPKPIQYDAASRTFRLKGAFANEAAAAEYIAVGRGSPEEHEALMTLDSIPSELAKALFSAGFSPANFDSRVEGMLELSPHSAFTLFVEYTDDAGALHRAPVEAFLRRQDSFKPLERRAWTFTGSRPFKDRAGKTVLRADINRFAIAFTNDPDAVINCASEDALNANVLDGAGSFVLNQPLIPKKGHPCWLVLQPWFPKAAVEPGTKSASIGIEEDE